MGGGSLKLSIPIILPSPILEVLVNVIILSPVLADWDKVVTGFKSLPEIWIKLKELPLL